MNRDLEQKHSNISPNTRNPSIFTRLGLTVIERVKSYRGGVYKVSNNKDELFALKFVDKSSELDLYESGDRETSLLSEARSLQLLDKFTNYIYVDHGSEADVTWLITRWIQGRSIRSITEDLNCIEDKVTRKIKLLQLFRKVFQKVGDLHDFGFVHGDLQPQHFLVDDENEIHLLDTEFVTKRKDVNKNYRGGLVHFNAPEVAEAILEEASQVPLDTLTDIYALAAVVFTTYTGVPMPNYGMDYTKAGYRLKLTRVAEGFKKKIINTNAKEFVELQVLLDFCAMRHREYRCNSLATAIHLIDQYIQSLHKQQTRIH